MTPAESSAMYLRKVAVGENIAVSRVEVKEGSITQRHSHSNEEVVIVLKGAWRFDIAGRQVTVCPNQMLIIPPEVEHSSEALKDTVALDICTPTRSDWVSGEDQGLRNDPDQNLWAV